jgi:GT2 family glycosyltransferase/2-polyprenyl-3-methyl-5-hydroxy-6-metoxy-1,4-benzoquinol methylase/glycosyltransferase involved in cell wall biosynthesis
VEPRARYDDERAFNPTPDSSYGKLLPLVTEGASVLDVGCSYGGFADALRRLRKARVVGIELDPVAAEKARGRCDALYVGDVAKLMPDLPGGFDVVVAADVLEHLVEPRPVLEGLAKLLAPGGALLASIPNVTHLSVVLALAGGRFPRSREGLLDATHLQFYGEADVLELFHAAGYAARIVDRVRLDPRLTEFRSDLSALPEESLAWLDRNPNADTYQFIVRAVPRAWARAEDDQEAATAPAEGGRMAGRLAAEVTGLHEELRKYHEALSQRIEADNDVRAQIAAREEALAAARARGDDAFAIGEVHRVAKRLRDRGPLPDEERGALRVLFVVDRSDAPFRYRCLHACEQLRESGVVANVARLDDPDLLAQLPSYAVVVLFRLPWSPRVAAVVEAARQGGARLAFDVDDLVFDSAVERQMPFLRGFDEKTVAAYRAQFVSLRATLERCDVCIAATPTIARHARNAGVRALVHPNLVSRGHLRLSALLAPLRPILLREPLLAYLSGSNTHDGDLASIGAPLREILSRLPDVRFVLCGFANPPAELHALRNRVIRVPYLDYRLYPWLIARCRAVVAPLEVVNEFTDAKSALKVFEAGAFGVPAVASASLQYAAAIEHGVSGFVARTESEWVEALLHLSDRNASLRAGALAREIALRDHSADAYAHVLARHLRELGGSASAEPPRLRALEFGAPARRRRIFDLPRSMLSLAAAPAQEIGHDVRRASEEDGVAVAALLAACSRREEPASPATGGARSAEHLAERLLDLDGETVGVTLADRERPLGSFSANAHVEPIRGITPRCRFRSLGPDPSFDLVPPSPGGPRSRYLALEMSAVADGEAAFAQLFWATSPRRPLSERNSLLIPIVADGTMRTYLVDLEGVLGKAFPARVARLRFDPIDRQGEFEVANLAFLERLHSSVDVRKSLARRFLRGDGIEIGALQNPLAVPAQARVRYVDRLRLAEMRASYPELDGQPLVDADILADAERLETIPADSQDFVICNHVLEHMRDPLGALRQWQRVLKPGGVLYLAIPDRTNPLDRDREITPLLHLLEDEEGAGRKGSDADRAAFADFVRSAHPEMTPEKRDAFVAGLLARDYSIHFHVFDRALFERVLLRACGGSTALVLARNAPDGQLEHIAILRKERVPERREVDVVVPIYNARELTRRCAESVLRHGPADLRVVLVDDASTDPGIAEDLRELARDGRVSVLRNETNLGFVKTANRGLRHASGRDVLLLNSDTEVFAGFLDGLRDAAYRDAKTGIVTPFSNNATIFSLPTFGENPIPEGHTAGSMARLVAGATRRIRPRMPTAVGFCMYIRAEVLERVGLFDEEAFGRGFGEENDLCERALEKGFEVRLCDDIFVWHKGKASFGGEGKELERQNAQVLRERHPRYEPAVAKFCRANPLAPLQAEVAFHIPRLREGARGAGLFVVHASPFAPSAGGTEHHVLDLVCALELPRAVIAHPEGAAIVATEVLRGDVAKSRQIRFGLAEPIPRFCARHDEAQRVLRRLVDLFGIRWAHLHHLLFWPIALGRTLREAGVPYVFTAHDYYAVCPSWNLFDYATRERCQCSHRDPLQGPGCLAALFAEAGMEPVDFTALRAAHRKAFLDTLHGAAAIVAPSQASRRMLLADLPLDAQRLHVIGHPSADAEIGTAGAKGAILRVALIGEISYALKGSDLYLELLDRSRGALLEWHVFGDVDKFGYGAKLGALGLGDRLVLHGAYPRGAIVRLLRESAIGLSVFLPAVDETFSLTLSESFLAGVPALVLDRGALPERVASAEAGFVVRSVREAAERITALAADPTQLAAAADRLRRYCPAGPAQVAQRYRDLYRSVGFDLAPDADLSPEWLHEVSERAGIPVAPLAMPRESFAEEAVAKAQPAPGASGLLRPLVRHLKPFVPRPVRDAIRTTLRRIEERPVLTLDVRRITALHALTLQRRRLTRAIFASESNDPQIEFQFAPFDPVAVGELRFALLRRDPGFAQAQLFWTHDPSAGFCEELSATIDLDGTPGEWREYRLRLDTSEFRSAWTAGARIARLRFDPTSAPGVFELGQLELLPGRDQTS